MSLRWADLARPLAAGFGAILFESPCAACGGEDGPICAGCREEILGASGSQCPRCALGLGPFAIGEGGCSWCRDRRLGFDEALAVGPYQGPIRELCLRMKTIGSSWAARWAADLLVEAHGERLSRCGADLVADVPLHWWRRMRRGYNQAEALAAALAARLGLPHARALRRTASTPKLASRGRTERDAIMRGAFRAAPSASLEGRTVILVDDILTTGATCGAAARALKAAGARRVVAAVVGRAEGRT